MAKQAKKRTTKKTAARRMRQAPKMLSDLFRKYDLDSEIPFRKSLSIDTTKRSPRNVAKLIARQYSLPESKEFLRR